MYLEHFGLKMFPFANTADPRFFFSSEAHEEALANMTYAIEQRKGLVMITGEVGAGKTLLLNMLSLRLRHGTVLVNITDPLLRGDQLMRCIHQTLLGEQSRRIDRMTMQANLMDRLMALQRMGQRVAVLVDESQDLSKGALEQLRLMSNWENHAEKLIQWVLVGQPELRERVQKPAWEHLRQRIVLTYHLGRLGRHQIGPYIEHRLCVAGGGGHRAQFEPTAVEAIADLTGGAPRLINNVCDAALLTAFGEDTTVVTDTVIASVVREMTICNWPTPPDCAEQTYKLPVALAG